MTGSLQTKKGKNGETYYVVLNLKDKHGKRKQKWIHTGLPVKGNLNRAKKVLRELLHQYENEELLQESKPTLFVEYVNEWLEFKKTSNRHSDL